MVIPNVNKVFKSIAIFICAAAAFLAASAAAQSEAGLIHGQSWLGQPAVRRTMAEIQAASAQHAPRSRATYLKPLLRRPTPPAAQTTTNALRSAEPSSTTSTSAATTSGSTTSGSTGTPQPLTPQVVSTPNFTAATFSDTHSWPPDTGGAAGPTQFIVALNGRFRSFNKQTAAQDGAINVDPDVFFSSVMTSNDTTTDPHIRYDRLSQRWIIVMIDVPGLQGTQPNRVLVAVSDGPNITSGTVWSFYQFEQDLVGTTPNTDTGNFADYPTLGVDANALYVGVNLFDPSGSFLNTTAFVIQKSSVLNGGPIRVTAFRGLVSAAGTGAYTPQGVDNYDPAATEGYFIGGDASSFSQLDLRRISNPGGTTPTMSANIPITTTTWALPINITPQGGVGPLDGGDDRLLAAHFRNGSLWTAHNVGVNGTGGRTSPTRNGVQWFQLTGIPTGKTPSVVQSGIVYEPASSGSLSYWMGTIMVSGQGHAAMGFSAAGPTNYIDAATTGRLATDPAGVMQVPVKYTASNAAYVPSDSSNPHRWGDFSYTSLDPSDDMTMWTVQEWSDTGGDGYGIQVVRLLAPPPGTPTNCSPASIATGTTNITVTLKGSRASGDGYYDPGAGFSNRLGVVISGSGVTVNSLTNSDPGTITMVLTVAANAATGARTIQVTNPDGQVATSASGLLTITAPANVAPTLSSIPDASVTAGNLLTFTATAGDTDGDKLTFSLGAAAPSGASIGANSGVFTWTPTQAQAGTNTLSVIVTDNGTPSMSATQTFKVVVAQSNVAPVLAPIAFQFLYVQSTMTVTNSATDANSGQALTYSLGAGAPAGATINPSTGLLTWTPTQSQTGTNNITVTVTDNGTPPLSDSYTFAAIVSSWPKLSIASLPPSAVRLSWDSIFGASYQVQYKTNLTNAAWSILVPSITSSSSTISVTNSTTNNISAYRLKVQ